MKVPVFYSPRMVAQSNSFSPSAGKPALVVDSWQRQFPIETHAVTPVTDEELCRAHDPAFVHGVLDGSIPNGFGNRSPEVAASLRYTSGSMLTAARYVLERNLPVAAAPCSGFHHAGYAHASGYCTFNGLMVTAMALIAERPGIRVGILDCDMHYGDGTDEILGRLAAQNIKHWTAGQFYGAPHDAQEFFDVLPEVIAHMADCDIVLYQAGADPHIDDPLGGWLTTKQLYDRDRRVFSGLKARGVHVAWNLAGGYQREADGSIPKVLEIHDNTMRAAREVYDI